MTRNVRTCPGNGLIDYAHAPSHHLMLDKIQREKFMPVGVTFEEPSWAYGWTLFPVEKLDRQHTPVDCKQTPQLARRTRLIRSVPQGKTLLRLPRPQFNTLGCSTLRRLHARRISILTVRKSLALRVCFAHKYTVHGHVTRSLLAMESR